MVEASLSEPHTSESFVLSTIHKKITDKNRRTSIFAHVMVHDTVS